MISKSSFVRINVRQLQLVFQLHFRWEIP